jgi:hypothetical protein
LIQSQAFPGELIAACQDMADSLYGAAGGDAQLSRAAAFVQRLYVRALAAAPTENLRIQRWRRFISALHAYVRRAPGGSSASAYLLRIVSENADLLEVHDALAS